MAHNVATRKIFVLPLMLKVFCYSIALFGLRAFRLCLYGTGVVCDVMSSKWTQIVFTSIHGFRVCVACQAFPVTWRWPQPRAVGDPIHALR